MRSLSPAAASLLLVVVVSACSTDPVTQSTGPAAGISLSRNMGDEPPHAPPTPLWTMDDEFERVARKEVPGFAGHFLDANGDLVVQVVDPDGSRRGAALAHAERMRTKLKRSSSQMLIRSAQYDWIQLRAWAQPLEAGMPRNGILVLDINEAANALWLEVKPEDVAGWRSRLAAMGIPANAVQVTELEGIEDRATLREQAAYSIRAGMQIKADGIQPCTLGLNVMKNGRLYFVTASHCTSVEDGPDTAADTLYQNDSTAGKEVGTEALDRTNYNCRPLNNNCRLADAALVRYFTWVWWVGFGEIAETIDTGSGAPGSVTIAANPDMDVIVSEPPFSNLPMGWEIFKTGRTTGRTVGTLTQSCISVQNYRCISKSDIYSNGGDSGSPVYDMDSNGGSIAIQGILQGGPVNDLNVTYFTPWVNVEAELGDLTVRW